MIFFSAVCLNVFLCVHGKEFDAASCSAWTCVDALGQKRAILDGLCLGVEIEHGLEQLIQVIGWNTALTNSCFPVDQAFFNHFHSKLHGCKAGALAVTCLKHPEFALLDGEFDILDIFVMRFQFNAHIFKLRVNLGHLVFQFRNLLGGTDTRDHIFALSVGQVLTVEHVFAACWVAGKRNTRAAIVAHVTENHGANVGSGAPFVGDIVLPTVDNCPVIHPRSKHRANSAPHLLMGIVWKIEAGACLHCLLEASHQFLQIGHRQFIVKLDMLFVLELFHDLFKRICFLFVGRLQTQHHVAIHLHETAVGVPSKSLVARLGNQTCQGFFIQTNVQNRIHHTRHRVAGTGSARNQKWIHRVAKLGSHFLLGFVKSFEYLRAQFWRIGALVVGKVGANLGAECEARGHRQADFCHFAQVGAFATQLGAHSGIAFC